MTAQFEWDTADGPGTYCRVGESTTHLYNKPTFGRCYLLYFGASWQVYIWCKGRIVLSTTAASAAEARSAIEALVPIYSNFTE